MVKVFIDKDCGVCVRLIKRIKILDSKGHLQIKSLDDLTAEGHFNLQALGESKTTLIVVETINNKFIYSMKGRAVIRLSRYLMMPFLFIGFLEYLPLVPKVADFLYTKFANNRKFFSKFM